MRMQPTKLMGRLLPTPVIKNHVVIHSQKNLLIITQGRK